MLLGWLMTAMTWLGLPWAWWSVGLPLLGMSLAGLGWRTGGGAARRVPVALHTLRGWEWGVLGVLLCLCAGVTLYALLMPVGDRDSWAMWAFKGQAFARDGAIAPVLRLYRQSDLHHPGYPPTQPLMQVWTYLAVGGIDERMAQLSFPVWYASCLGLVWWAGWRWSGRRSAWAWTLLLATTPIVLDHATLNHADLPLAVAWLLGGIALALWVEDGARRWLAVGVLACAGGAWLKVDGAYLGPAFLGLALALRLLTVHRQALPLRPALIQGLLALGALLMLSVPWYLYAASLDVRPSTPDLEVAQVQGWQNLARGATVIGSEILLSDTNSAYGLMGGGFGALWLLVAGAWLCGWRRLGRDPALWFLALAVVGSIGGYLTIYVARPFFSVDRYLLHLAPLAIVAAQRATASMAASASDVA